MTSNSSWHSAAWVEAEKALDGSEKSSGGCRKTGVSCQNRWTALKKEYVQVKQLRDKSGFGWDDGLSRVTATDEVWDALIKSEPKLAKWRKTAFPLYDSMHELVVGTVATGEGAFRPGRDFTPLSDFPDEPHDDVGNASRGSRHRSSSVLSYIQEDRAAVNDRDIDATVAADPAPLEPITPWKANENGRKRTADDDLSSASSSKRSRGRKPTAGHAITEVASSVRDLASAFIGSMGSSTTPERKAAIQKLEDDDDLSDHEQIQAIQLFRKDSSIAQSYLAIGKKGKRTLYIQTELASAA